MIGHSVCRSRRHASFAARADAARDTSEHGGSRAICLIASRRVASVTRMYTRYASDAQRPICWMTAAE
jgi:hypothetical protein